VVVERVSLSINRAHSPSTEKGKILIFESCSTAIHHIYVTHAYLAYLRSYISCTAIALFYAPVTNFFLSFFHCDALLHVISSLSLYSLTYSLACLLDKLVLTLNLLVFIQEQTHRRYFLHLTPGSSGGGTFSPPYTWAGASSGGGAAAASC